MSLEDRIDSKRQTSFDRFSAAVRLASADCANSAICRHFLKISCLLMVVFFPWYQRYPPLKTSGELSHCSSWTFSHSFERPTLYICPRLTDNQRFIPHNSPPVLPCSLSRPLLHTSLLEGRECAHHIYRWCSLASFSGETANCDLTSARLHFSTSQKGSAALHSTLAA